MKLVSAVAAAIALLGFGVAAQANVYDLGSGLTNLETVTVGNPGNAADTRFWSNYGNVSYSYKIGKYEVTAGQYTDFLNAKAATDSYQLYNPLMWTDTYGCKIQRSGSTGNYTYSIASQWANRPVNYVSYWDACRFANWLGNGQGSGDTENGGYTLGGYNDNDGRAIQRNAGWQCAVTSENEWYKAAYHKGGSPYAGYWGYATRSDSAPANKVLATDPGNSANYYTTGYSIGYPYYRTNVGEFEHSASAYGTFDQGGNVWEWNEAIPSISGSYAYRGLRGGSFSGDPGDWQALQSSTRDYSWATDEEYHYGFRIVQAVPEPSSIIPLAGGLLALVGVRRRRALVFR